MTQCALLLLLICGDDLSRVNRRAVIDSLAGLQQPDGRFARRARWRVGLTSVRRSFCAVRLNDSVEQDMRFTYSAAVVSFLLDDWRGFDK